MPGCDCRACWEHRLQPGPTACLPVPPCERDHMDDQAPPLLRQQPGAAPQLTEQQVQPTGSEEYSQATAESITQFIKGVGSRAIARLLGRAQAVDMTTEDGLEPWQKYAAATAMSEAPRPAMVEEMDRYTNYDSLYGNPVAQLEHDQYEQNDITTQEIPHTKTELASRMGKSSNGGRRPPNQRTGGKKACAKNSGRFVNNKVQELETDQTVNNHLSITGQMLDAFRDKPSAYEVELMAAEAADRELERREAVANGEIDNIDPTADECVIM